MTTSPHARTATDLNHVFGQFGVRGDITADGDTVTVPAPAAQRLLAAIGFIQGGGRVPFIRTLLQRTPGRDVELVGDEARHLLRELTDVLRSQQRADKIDRGTLPGALSAAEVSRLARKHPHLFAGR